MNRISLSPPLLVSPSRLQVRLARRRGAFLVIVMICLLLSSLLVGALLKLALLQARQLSQEQLRLQADWLAESGLERAALKLAGDADYPGETWNLEPRDLGGAEAALVTIRVEKEETQTRVRAVTIEAVYPADGPLQVRRKLAATVAVSEES